MLNDKWADRNHAINEFVMEFYSICANKDFNDIKDVFWGMLQFILQRRLWCVPSNKNPVNLKSSIPDANRNHIQY